MPKRESMPSPSRAGILGSYSAEELQGAKLVINEPITLAALRKWAAEFDKPEEGYAVMLMVGYGPDDAAESERKWYVYNIDVFYTDRELHRKLLWAVPTVGRFTPLVTKRQAQKTYRTLETLVRQFTEIFGKDTDLSIYFNWEHRLKNRGIPGMVGQEE